MVFAREETAEDEERLSAAPGRFHGRPALVRDRRTSPVAAVEILSQLFVGSQPVNAYDALWMGMTGRMLVLVRVLMLVLVRVLHQ